MAINIAIDGPSGAGKSTLSKAVAKEIGFIYVDTGALYRAIGLFVYENGTDPDDILNVEKCLLEINLNLLFDKTGQHVILNGRDVSDIIRMHLISEYASKVSAYEKVRSFLFDTQRKIAAGANVIMDGRDIGTVVLPDAQLKIFLFASPHDRAMRRYEELLSRGQSVIFEQVLADILQRDERDSLREVAPLKPAPEAIILDTTGNSFEKSYNIILNIIKERGFYK